MEEIFDRLALRLILVISCMGSLILFRLGHVLFYPNGHKQLKIRFNPISNPTNTLHLAGRIIGIACVYLSIDLNPTQDIWVNIVHFLIWSLISFILYLISIYILESSTLGQFEYKEEVLKGHNYAYALICFTLAVCSAFLTSTIVSHSNNSILLLVALWLLGMVLFTLSLKLYGFLSKFSFAKQVVRKDIGVACSFSGFVIAITIVFSMAFNQDHYDLTTYGVQVILKILLSLLIAPIVLNTLRKIFRIQKVSTDQIFENRENTNFLLGLGIYDGALLISTALITTMTVDKLKFQNIINII